MRLSGPRAIAIASTMVRGTERTKEQPSHTVRRATIVDAAGEPIDDALCAVMRGPRSYTGEDVVELSCHGSPIVLRLVLERALAEGARLAQPGEFTRRAYVNGRLDLAQAEAVALLISARTERAARLAARGLAGELGRVLGDLRDRLLDVIAGLEATLDFPDDMVGPDPHKVASDVDAIAARVGAMLDAAHRARVVHEGVTVTLVGAPNAGKSSLLNALVGRERAIVSPLPGTTRDVIEASLVVDGVPVTLRDTAGIDEPRGAVEAEGIRRTRVSMLDSDLLVVVVDGSAAPPLEVLAETASRPRVVVLAKSDLSRHPAMSAIGEAVAVSSVTGDGLGALVGRLAHEIGARCDAGAGLLATVRQLRELSRLRRCLERAAEQLRSQPLEVALVDLHEALGAVSEVLGITAADDVLDRIFSTFCLGK